MATLVTIGDFSKMTYLTVKALRHYHDIGLLEPVSIDEQNGYRLYATDQVAVAQTIRRFRELDMPTDEIETVLAANDDATRRRGDRGRLDGVQTQLDDSRHGGGPADAARRHDRRSRGFLSHSCAHARGSDPRDRPLRRGRIVVRAGLRRELQCCSTVEVRPPTALTARCTTARSSRTVWVSSPRSCPCGATCRQRVAVVQMEVPGFDAAVAHTGAFDDLDQTYRALGTHVLEAGVGADGRCRENTASTATPSRSARPITCIP